MHLSEEKFYMILEDMCYDRALCEFLDIDYVNMGDRDIKKIKNYLLELCDVEEHTIGRFL